MKVQIRYPLTARLIIQVIHSILESLYIWTDRQMAEYNNTPIKRQKSKKENKVMLE